MLPSVSMMGCCCAAVMRVVEATSIDCQDSYLDEHMLFNYKGARHRDH